MAFSREALDFLAENRLRDSRDWFKAHKGDYERLVLAPMQELVVRLTPVMRAIDPQLICEPRVGRSISRIYRDTRFSRDKSIYRANVWCIFIRDKQLWEGPPAFYADISPAGYSYGCGYYQASAASMAIIREMVLAGDRTFRAAAAALRAQPAFALEGGALQAQQISGAAGGGARLARPQEHRRLRRGERSRAAVLRPLRGAGGARSGRPGAVLSVLDDRRKPPSAAGAGRGLRPRPLLRTLSGRGRGL
jgi:uncharacterized protein (TIGR02453 family)